MRARIFAVWLISFILGSMVAPWFESMPSIYLNLGLLLVVCALLVYAKRYVFGLLFGIGLFLLAISLFQTKEQLLVEQNKSLINKESNFVGVVSDIPTKNEFGQTIELKVYTINSAEKSMRLKAYLGHYPEVTFGQTIKFDGVVKPFEDKKWRLIKDGFAGEINVKAYTLTAARNDSLIIVKGWLFSVRNAFNSSIQRSLPSAESGLASGLILGEKALITPEVTRQLQISGMTHIIALSGYNITIILGLFLLFSKKLSRLAKLVVPITFILIFTVMTGGAASLVRAAIMGFMPILASYLGRESDSFIAILFSAVIMLIFNPFLALYDVGFQLSFAALAGMIYLAPLIQKLVTGLPEYISFPFAETIGAQLAAMPLISYYFGMISLISPVSNIVILALVPLGMFVSFIIGLTGIFSQLLANVFAIPGYVVLHGINLLISFFGSLPAASQNIKIENPIWIFLIYFILFDIWLLLYKVRRQPLSE